MIEGRDFAAASTVGARERQEDDWGTHVNPPAKEGGARLLATVADGMGGMPAGDRASAIALRAFLDSYPTIHLPARERLRRALAHSNREVGITVETDPALAGMGSTLVAALFFSGRCEWLSVGDSLLLLIRDGTLERVNPLHIYANTLEERVRGGQITAAAAACDPDRSALTSVVQGTVLEEVAQGEFQLIPGDVVILATDGVLTLADHEIVATCAEQGTERVEPIAEALIARVDAAARNGQDNATVIVVRHRQEQREESAVLSAIDDEHLDSTAGSGTTSDVADHRVRRLSQGEVLLGATEEGSGERAVGSEEKRSRPLPPASTTVLALALGLLAGIGIWHLFARL